MMLIYWFLPMILFLGIVTSYQDIKIGKIRNKWILWAVYYSVLVNIIITIFYFLNGTEIRSAYFIELGLTVLLSLTMGVIIWLAGLWTAGDAKLFFAFSILLPLEIYKYGHIPFLSSANILINTFTPIFIFLAFSLLFKTSLKQKIFHLKKSFEPKQIFQLFVFLFAFFWVIELVGKIFNLSLNYFSSIIFLLLLIILLERALKSKLFSVVLIIAISRIFFDASSYTPEHLKFLFFIWMSFILLRFFFLYLGFNFLTKQVDINLLKSEMVPAERIYVENKNYKKESIMHFGFFSHTPEKTKKKNYLFDVTAKGLTKMDVQKLKKLEKKLGFEHLRIHQTLSFAPFMFAGVLLTILFQGNLFIYLTLFFV